MIRATIDNADGRFKPEMFASVTIVTEENGGTLAVARDAVIFEADSARVWVAHDDKSIELRQIKTGSASGKMIQVLDGSAARREGRDARQPVRRQGGKQLAHVRAKSPDFSDSQQKQHALSESRRIRPALPP